MQAKTSSSTKKAPDAAEHAVEKAANVGDLDLRLSDEVQAATLLLQQLRSLESIGNEFDDETIADTIEGGTNLFEAIDRLIEIIHADAAWIKGMKEQEDILEGRRKRYEARNERRIWAIQNALKLAKRDRHQHPLCTITYAKGRKNSRVEITDEDKIPADYYTDPKPEISKSKVGAALREGKEVPGATLADGEDGYRLGWK